MVYNIVIVITRLSFIPLYVMLLPEHFWKKTKLHSGYNSCEKYEQHGEYVGGVASLKTDATLRTDAAFDEMIDEDHHYVPVLSSLVLACYLSSV